MAIVSIKKQDLEAFRRQIRRIVSDAATKTFSQMGPLLLRESEILTSKIESSTDFQELSGRLVGEFGFTPEEVARIHSILPVIRQKGRVTNFVVKSTARNKQAILEWVDMDALKEHPLAQHDLTKYNPDSGQFELTETISWVEWFEEGATVRGYQFFKVGGIFKKYSRSGQGLMRRQQGGIWMFEPTRLFDITARKYNIKNLRRGFGLLFRSNMEKV